jgi:hypothetical protein
MRLMMMYQDSFDEFNQDIPDDFPQDEFGEFSQDTLSDDVQHEVAEVVRNQGSNKKKRR